MEEVEKWKKWKKEVESGKVEELEKWKKYNQLSRATRYDSRVGSFLNCGSWLPQKSTARDQPIAGISG